MNILCIDTSQQALTVGVVLGGRQYFHHEQDAKLKHSQTLMDTVDAVIKQGSADIRDLDAFMAVCGPGSFTGIRIGITTVRAFAQLCEKPCIAVNSLSVMTYNIKTCKKYIVPLIDAMQNKFYYAVYDSDGRELHAPDICLQSDILPRVCALCDIDEADIQFVCQNPPPFLHGAVPPADIAQSLADIAKTKAAQGEFVHYKQVLPVYAAVSQAEKNFVCK